MPLRGEACPAAGRSNRGETESALL